MTAYVSAGGYGPNMMPQQRYVQPQIYQQTQMYAQQPYVQYAYSQPQVAYGQGYGQAGGSGGSGGLLGQSGAAAGSIIPIVIICKLWLNILFNIRFEWNICFHACMICMHVFVSKIPMP